MAGLIPFTFFTQRHFVFDLKLWVIVKNTSVMPTNAICFTKSEPTLPRDTMVTAKRLRKKYMLWLDKLLLLGGTSYMIAAIIGSILYIQVARVNFANDLSWANFNLTVTHVFLGTWLNEQLALGTDKIVFNLDASDLSYLGAIDPNSPSISIPSTFGSHVQHSEFSTLQAAISSLRTTQACSVPWIFTQYCYLDFSKRWELANSAFRQKRCIDMASNGALYVEAILRNVVFNEFLACWGDAFNISIVNEVVQSKEGREWLTQSAFSSRLSITDEIQIWQSYNLSTFDTQWQNFKSIGIQSTYSIVNAYGVTFPFTLQSQRGSYRLQEETTFKMYWGFASDLVAVTDQRNNSGIVGRSLIRSSSKFAFANISMESILTINGTLQSPLSNSLALFRSFIGPFGSIDMIYINCPSDAKLAVRRILSAIRATVSENVSAQDATKGWKIRNVLPTPPTWSAANFFALGGTPLCPEQSINASFPVTTGLAPLFSFDMQCTISYSWAALSPTIDSIIASVILTGLPLSETDICKCDQANNVSCIETLKQSRDFVQTFMVQHLPALQPLKSFATQAIRNIHVELIQFGKINVDYPLQMYRLMLLDPNETSFTYFAWLFLIDWTKGMREVVSFQGDVGSITLLSEYLTPLNEAINMAEAPVNFSAYMRAVVLYVSAVMLAVAGVTLVYIGLCHGHVEVLNLLELNRVGAIVWIGRPLLFIRSLTALSLLSTATVQLVYNGYETSFREVKNSFVKIVLAANEVTWMVAILNDILMIWSQEYTIYYATMNSILVWFVTAVMSLYWPVDHQIAIDKSCVLTEMGFQLTCHSATITIGWPSRLVTLALMIVGCNILCYGTARLFLRNKKVDAPVDSALLYAGSKYLFLTSNWTFNNVYFMDRASAVLNGLLTFRYNDVMYGLDIKQWRIFTLDVPDDSSTKLSRHSTRACLPLID
ncbi:hypothetical protein AC1031_021051 [Aphanomyces cochlioides]|nr:hypothetical protein AC1031_021051 [Aphanomyces cochlioides]